MQSMNHSLLNQGRPIASFTISTEVSKSSILSFPKFLMESSGAGKFGPIAAGGFNQIAGEHGKFLIFNAKWYQENYDAVVRIRLDTPLHVEIFSAQGENKNFSRRLEDYLLLTLQAFEEIVRAEMIYMTFVPGSEETSKLSARGKLSERFLTGNMLNLILLSFLLSAVIVIFVGPTYGPIVLMVTFLAIMLSAGKIMALTSNWRITNEHPDVVIVECKLDNTIMASFMQTYGQSLPILKKKVYDLMTEKRRIASPEEVASIFSGFGIVVSPDQIIVKRVDIYNIVKRAAEKFEMPTPTIMITKNFKPNAAATGFTKHLATMLITIGLIVQLEDKEIELVVGHELSHLRFGDPAILFSIIVTEYLARVYLYSNYLMNTLVFFSYIFLIFWLIFFFGKFLEARADLEAAYILRDPQTMANSLKKIGFRRLALDIGFIEGRDATVDDWFAFDPHPPIGYRIRRMERLDLNTVPVGYVPKHTLLRSIADVFGGIRAAMRR